MDVAADTVALNIMFEGLLSIVLSIMMKKSLLLKQHTQFKTRVEKPYPIAAPPPSKGKDPGNEVDQNGQIDTLFYTTKTTEKTHSLGPQLPT